MIRSLRPLELTLLGITALLAALAALIISGTAHSPGWLPEQAPRNPVDRAAQTTARPLRRWTVWPIPGKPRCSAPTEALTRQWARAMCRSPAFPA